MLPKNPTPTTVTGDIIIHVTKPDQHAATTEIISDDLMAKRERLTAAITERMIAQQAKSAATAPNARFVVGRTTMMRKIAQTTDVSIEASRNMMRYARKKK